MAKTTTFVSSMNPLVKALTDSNRPTGLGNIKWDGSATSPQTLSYYIANGMDDTFPIAA